MSSAALFGVLPKRRGVVDPVDQNGCGRLSAAAPIPKMFHQIWLGNAKIPKEYDAFTESWRRLHPDWKLKLWTDDNLPLLQNNAAYAAATSWAQKSDIVRLEILLKFGGVYLDHDMECLRNISPITSSTSAFLPMRDDYSVTNCILGTVPRHPFFARLVQDIGHSLASQPEVWASVSTGPGYLTRMLDAHPDLCHDIALYGSDTFLPYLPHEEQLPVDQYAKAFGIHHYATSWLPEENRQYTHAQWTSRRYRLCVVTDFTDLDQLAAVMWAFEQTVRSDTAVDLVVVPGPGISQDRADRIIASLNQAIFGEGRGAHVERVEVACRVSHDRAIAISAGQTTRALEFASFLVRLAEIGRISSAYARPRLAILSSVEVEVGGAAELMDRFNSLER